MLTFWQEIEETLPPEEVTQILKMGAYYGLTPKSPEWVPFALSRSTLMQVQAVQKSIESLIATIPQQQKISLELFNKSLYGYITTIEKTFSGETQRRSEQVADACAKKLEAVLSNSRAPLVANMWLSVIVGFAVCSGTLAAFWIVYKIPVHGWLALALAVPVVLAKGTPFCQRFWNLIYRG